MLAGIISDSHDNMSTLKKAVALFNKKKVRHVIHAGDFTSPFTFRILKELRCGFTGIFGNNDGDKLLLQNMSGGKIFNQPYLFELSDRKIVLLHEHFIVDSLADSSHYDLVIYGHTHKPEIRKNNETLIINPGESGGWLYGKSTVALLDMSNMKGEIVNIDP